MINWIKIDNDVFHVDDVSVQLSMGSHASIYLSIDISKYPSYKDYFIKKYDAQNSTSGQVLQSNSNGLPTWTTMIKFDMISSKFIAKGCIIKSIDTDFTTKINLNIKCDMLETADLQGRREERIEDILNDKTLSDKDDIK